MDMNLVNYLKNECACCRLDKEDNEFCLKCGTKESLEDEIGEEWIPSKMLK